MKPYWTICDERGTVIVENIYDYHAAQSIVKKLVAEFGRTYIVREYGLKSVAMFTPKRINS